MLKENKIEEEEIYVEKSTTNDGRKKEQIVKEEKIGEETHKVLEVFEEIPLKLKLKTKVIEKKKNFELVYEKETITYDIETGEVVEKLIEKIDLPVLKAQDVSTLKSVSEEKTENKQIKSILKSLKEKTKPNNKANKILDNVLLGVVVLQLLYLVYYFIYN